MFVTREPLARNTRETHYCWIILQQLANYFRLFGAFHDNSLILFLTILMFFINDSRQFDAKRVNVKHSELKEMGLVLI